MKKIKKQFNKHSKWLLSVFAIAAILFVSSCDDDDDPPPQATDDIMDIVDKTSTVSTLGVAIDSAGLRSTLQGTGPFTVFAPTNDAFAKINADTLAFLLSNPAELTKVLTYHVVSGTVLSSQLQPGNVPTLNTGQELTIDLSGGAMINNAMVVTPDIEATNGVIHIIDEVLIPGNLDFTGIVPSVAEAAASVDSLSVLVEILSLDGLSDILTAASNDNATLTVFAPTNTAFQAVLDALGLTDIDEIPEDVLLDIVEYHIIGSVAKSTDLEAISYETLNGESVTVDLMDGVKVDDANVTLADIEVSNGVVHIVDAVLLPSLYKSALGTIVEVPLFRKEYSTLTAALSKAELVETLLGDGPFTVFAPNNAAFEAAGITSLDNLTKEDLTPILLYHVLGAKVLSSELPEDGMATTLNDNQMLFLGYLTNDVVLINGLTQITGVDIEKSNGVIHTINKTLVPPAPDVVDIAAALADMGDDSEFTVLVSLLTSDSLSAVATALKEAENVTVFAPTDAAFDAISDVVPTLNASQLTEILQYHATGSRVFSTNLSNDLNVDMLSGESVTVNISGSDVSITDKSGEADANVIEVNYHGSNGVIHVIDKVLIPTL